MNNKQNLELLSLLLSKNRSEVEHYINNNIINFRNFNKFLRLNRIDGYIYTVISDNNLSDIFSQTHIDEYKYHYEYQLQKNTELVTQCTGLQKLLTINGFDQIFLKGPFFTMRYYGDLGKREIADMDILIKNNKSTINEINKLLTSHGFKLRSTPLFGWYISNLFTHHYEYSKESFKLDMHWVLQSHFSFNINYENIWITKQTYILDGNKYNILSDEYELVFRILSIFMDIQLGTIRLKSFIDLFKIIEKIDSEIDWNIFFEARKEEGLLIISVNVIETVFSLLGCSNSFPNLNKHIKDYKTLNIYKSFDETLSLIESERFAIKNKLWAFKAYNSTVIKSIAWWLISLPVKLLIYKEATKKSAKNLFKR